MNRTMKKAFGLLMTLALILSACAFSVSAAELEGDGTDEAPYIIENASQLDLLSSLTAEGESFAGKFISLRNDVTASEDFSPIGTKESPFMGSFDGNGYTLSGFSLDCDYAAVFGYCSRATISSLTVSGEFFAESYAGAIVAYAKDTVIEDCQCAAYVYADNFTGGIAGYIESGKITDCTSSASSVIGGYKENCGGIAGYSGAVISGCTNNAYTFGVKNVGGIAGYSVNEIASSANMVAVSADTANTGGIAGTAKGKISFCKNSGYISGKANTGGIAGYGSEADIKECMQTGSVSATGNYAGGIGGYLTDGSISNCLSAGAVSSSSGFAGGIFGSTSKTAVTNCVFASKATSSASSAAAIGAISGGSVADCYYNSALNEKAFISAVSGCTASAVSEAALTNEATFKNWDFNSVWTINVIHASYPLLMSVPFHTLNQLSHSGASCTEDGKTSYLCSVCNEIIDVTLPATGHRIVTVSERLPSCSVDGYKDTICELCGETSSESLPALGHKDANADNICDVCKSEIKAASDEEEKSIFEKIADFFRAIFQWLGNLFK